MKNKNAQNKKNTQNKLNNKFTQLQTTENSLE